MRLHVTAIGRLVGHLGFLLLIAMSIVLSRERVLFVDSAAQLFELIQRGTFVIYDHRYTMAITQLLPLAGIKLGLPLPALVVLYSVSAPLLAYLVFLLLAYRLKDLPLALLLLLPMLCIRHTFFHAISETFSLMIYATLLLALLRHRCGGIVRIVGIALCTVACVFMHPIGMFFVLFLLGYHLLDNWRQPTSAFWVGGAALMAAVVVKLNLPSGHDATYMPSVTDALFCLAHPARVAVARRWFELLPDLYLYPVALYGVALVWHLRRRQWLRMGWGLTFSLAFFLMTAVVYHADEGSVAVERAWLPLVFFAGVPVVCEVAPALCRRRQAAALLLFAAVLLLAYGKIVDSSKYYRQRLMALQSVVDYGRREGYRKMVAEADRFESHFKVRSWATAFETLILSSMQGSKGTVTLYLEEQSPFVDIPDYHVQDAYLAVPWNRLWSYSTLNPRYFRLPLQSTVQFTPSD